MSARKPKAQAAGIFRWLQTTCHRRRTCDDTVVIAEPNQPTVSKRDVEVAILKAIASVAYELSKASIKAFA